MKGRYLGTLSDCDPLYGLLFAQYPGVSHPRFHVERMSHRDVYKYTEENTGLSVVGKFYALNDPDTERIARKKGEFDNLKKIRSYGFDKPPFIIVRPMGREETIGLAVMEEYVKGKDLDHFLKKAIHEGASMPLRDALASLASFLFSLHSRTAHSEEAPIHQSDAYFEKVMDKLSRQSLLPLRERFLLSALKERWLARLSTRKVGGVIIHGDATPTNFLFTVNHGVVAIDLERMKRGDPCYDIGMVCGEIKHAFSWRIGDGGMAEPFIHHFLSSYCREAVDHRGTFYTVTSRIPFYMALTELRIARNDYLETTYRKRLVGEAIECLRWGLVTT